MDSRPDQVPRPTDLASLREHVVKGELRRSSRMVRIGSYMLLHVERVAFGNLAMIAREARVSATTAMRFVNALGFDHFPDLQALFRAHLLREADSLNAVDGGRVLSAICEAAGSSVDALSQSIPADLFVQAASMLAVPGIVYVIGKKSAFPLGVYFHTLLLLIGVRTVLLESSLNDASDLLRFVTSGDVAFVASFAPHQQSTGELVQSLAARSIATVVVADKSFSPPAAPGAIRLEVDDPSISGCRIPLATVALVEALAAAIARRQQRPCAAEEESTRARAPRTFLCSPLQSRG